MSVSRPKFTGGGHTPTVIVFGGRAFGRSFDLDEVRGWGPHDGSRALIRRERDTRALKLSLPCEDPGKKVAVCKPGTESAGTLVLDFKLPEP